MAQDTDDEFSRLWQRHLTALRDDFSATSIQALPSLPSTSRSLDGEVLVVGALDGYQSNSWDGKMDSAVDALNELTLQSPNTADTHSFGTPWFPDGDAYTETVLSSPANSTWPPAFEASRNPTAPSIINVEDVSGVPLLESRKKGVEYSEHGGTGTKVMARHDGSITIPFLLQRQLLSASCAGQAVASDTPTPEQTTAAMTATTALPTPTSPAAQGGLPTQVHALVLTWAKQDRRGGDGLPLTSGLDSDPEGLRACLKRRGYRVQCRAIPRDYPTAAVETVLSRFLEKSAAHSLLLIYYQGYGSLDPQGRMVFSSGPGHDESSFVWDDVREPIMQVAGDVLLVFDCTAPPGARAEQREMRLEAGLASSAATKQLLGVCLPPTQYRGAWLAAEDVLRDDMTRSLCRTLDRMSGVPVLTVQRLCSLMREDLRGTGIAPRVFVSQLGGGQLLDIHLPSISASPGKPKQIVRSG